MAVTIAKEWWCREDGNDPDDGFGFSSAVHGMTFLRGLLPSAFSPLLFWHGLPQSYGCARPSSLSTFYVLGVTVSLPNSALAHVDVGSRADAFVVRLTCGESESSQQTQRGSFAPRSDGFVCIYFGNLHCCRGRGKEHCRRYSRRGRAAAQVALRSAIRPANPKIGG